MKKSLFFAVISAIIITTFPTQLANAKSIFNTTKEDKNGINKEIESPTEQKTKEIEPYVNFLKKENMSAKEYIFWYRRLGRRDISIFGKWKKDFIWEQTQLNFTDASRAMKIVMNIYQN